MKLTLENDILYRYKLAYETVFQALVRVEDDSSTDKALAIINLMATYAWHRHPGRFADLRLEYWASKIGKKIWLKNTDSARVYIPVNSFKQRVLHVASETYSVGGHTRLLLNLIQADQESIHSLVLTSQAYDSVPIWLREVIVASGGSIVSLVAESYAQRVASLQQKLSSEADKIFYHIHPNDSVAVAALSAVPRPQVLIINHADHVFWLGSATSDMVICFREWALNNATDRRNAQKVMLLPIPLNFPPIDVGFKQKARQNLFIDSNKIVLLTVASFYKFIPSGNYNYFKTIKKVLDNNPNTILKIVGVSQKDDLKRIGFEHHDRMELVGVIDNPQLYYEAADIYIDAMPVGSYTSLLEAMYFCCFPILQFSPTDILNTEKELATKGLITHARDECEQIHFIEAAIKSEGIRNKLTILLADRIKDNYLGLGWKSYLKNIYKASSDHILDFKSIGWGEYEPALTTHIDNDAALLAYSNSNVSEDILAMWISRNLHLISFWEMVKLFLVYNFRFSKFEYNFSIKSFLWLFRKKLLNII